VFQLQRKIDVRRAEFQLAAPSHALTPGKCSFAAAIAFVIGTRFAFWPPNSFAFLRALWRASYSSMSSPLQRALEALVSSPEALSGLVSAASESSLLPVGLFAAASLLGLSVFEKAKEQRDQAVAEDTSVRNPHAPPALIRLLKNGRRKLLSDVLDVGAFFGLDIGGSLAKLVFFFPDSDLTRSLLERGKAQVEPHRRRDWTNRLKALANINDFIQSQENYGATGKREAGLAFHSEELGGAFHFIHFETRRMKGAFTLARDNGLTWGMSRLCATGGGAHRFLGLARDLLGVELDSRDEIDCLVKGMAFLIGYVRGEAYTFIGR
jgi:Fumble